MSTRDKFVAKINCALSWIEFTCCLLDEGDIVILGGDRMSGHRGFHFEFSLFQYCGSLIERTVMNVNL